ncbi:MAG: NADH-quinone oxidoreductase subunit J [Acidimicrobiales bacterium]
MSLEVFVFLLAGLVVLSGAIGVVLSRHPVHAALFLIQTLFGVAVLFLVVEAHFLAAIQVIVYAGAIVILFLFVIMLLGVDRAEDLKVEPIVGQRWLAVLSGAALLGLLLAIVTSADTLTGNSSQTAALDSVDPVGARTPDVELLAETIFTDYVFAFEVTGLVLTIAVVGAVVMARKVSGDLQPIPEGALSLAASAAADPAEPADSDDEESEEEGSDA